MTSEASNGAPPAFATAPWGYKRAEVDSWASWVNALLAHGRNETVRADSAEATLQATLERLEQLQHTPPNGAATRGPAPGEDGAAASVRALPRRVPPASEPVGPPSDGPDGTGPGDREGDRDDDRPEMARLQVVERTLHEVMTLLHRLAGPEKP